MAEVKAPVLDVLNLGCGVEDELQTRRQPTYALFWRLFAVPRILYLEQGTTFEDTLLVAYAAGATLPEDWLPAPSTGLLSGATILSPSTQACRRRLISIGMMTLALLAYPALG